MDNSLTSPKTRTMPLTGVSEGPASLNDRLNTNYIDIKPDDDSILASLTRTITECVGRLVTPKQMLGVIRVLKAITLCFLFLNMTADLMYISLLEVFANEKVRTAAGGSRDTIIRVYGLLLSVIAIGLEIDASRILKSFSGLRGFIPRAMLLFFIAAITRSHPSNNGSGYSKAMIDDAYTANNDDDNGGDDLYHYGGDGADRDSSEIPSSAVVFQIVTSSILGLCAFVYFAFGLACFDRFTSKAFLSTKDPLVTTAIPQPARRGQEDQSTNDSSSPYIA